jgi:ArsR family transcriptional regulator
MFNTKKNQCDIFECEICKIFSNPCRLKILIALYDAPKTVSELIKITKISQSVVSQHLSIMKLRGVLDTERKGSFIVYHLKYPEMMDAFDIMRKVTYKISKE